MTAGITRQGPEAREAKDRLGRVGLIGKGVVYGVVGLLAIQLATGDAAEEASTGGAIEWVAEQPFGRFLLVALTVALFALAAWRFLDAVVGDPVEGDETSDRVKFAVQGIVYLALAVAALSTTIANWSGSGDGGGGSGESGQQQEATARVLEWPAGQWIVIAVGLAVIGFAVYAFKKHVLDQEYLERLDVGRDHWASPLGRAGYAARSVVYLIIGGFFVEAGWSHDPAQAEGMSAALADLAGGWTSLLLWAVALGFLAFGVFCVAEAKYRRAA